VSPAVGYTLCALLGVLAVAEVVSFATRRGGPGGELSRRIHSWWVMVLGVGAALLLDRYLAFPVMLVMLAGVSYLALKEYLSMVPTRQVDRVVLLVAYLAIPTQWWWIHVRAYGLFVIWVPVYLFLVLPSVMVLRGEPAGFLRALGTLYWGVVVCVFAIGHVGYLYVLPGNDMAGAGLLLALLLLGQGNDVAQYLWGKLLGRHRIAPTVSPNKTVEGFLGGLATTVTLAWFVGPLLTPLSPVMAAAAGALVASSGFLGDLTMSAVKRDIGIKDTGRLIPGHGGVLDRVDSLVFAAPVFLHFVRYFHY
jgi:phosphatidate cytidylyltransferase